MTKKEIDKANRIHNLIPVPTMLQLQKIVGKVVVARVCNHLNVNEGEGENARSLRDKLKNIENKFRRLP